MEQFLRESVKTEVEMFKYNGVDKSTMKSEIQSLFEMYQAEDQLTEDVRSQIVNKVTNKVIGSIDKDIRNVRIIIKARKDKGLDSKHLEAKIKSFESLKTKFKDPERNSAPVILAALVSYAKMILATVAILGSFVGIGAGVFMAKAFGLDNLLSNVKEAGKSAVASGKGLSTGSLDTKSIMKQIKASGASAKQAKKAKEALDSYSGGNLSAAELRKRLEMVKGRGMEVEGEIKGILKQVDKSEAMKSAAKDGAKPMATNLLANAVKIIAVCVVLSVLLTAVSKIVLGLYAGKIKRDAAKSMVEKAASKSTGQVKSKVAQLKKAA